MNANEKLTHTAVFKNFYSADHGREITNKVETSWFEELAEARTQQETYKAAGAYFTRVFVQPGSSLGTYRAVGHFEVLP